MDSIAAFIQQCTQMSTLSAILGGFAFSMTVTLFLSREQRKLTRATALVFSASAMLFIYAVVVFALLIGAVADTASATPFLRLGANATYVTFAAVLILLAGTALAGWLHSRFVGLIATIFVAGTVVALFYAVSTIISVLAK
jgi:hypothetical protein